MIHFINFKYKLQKAYPNIYIFNFILDTYDN